MEDFMLLDFLRNTDPDDLSCRKLRQFCDNNKGWHHANGATRHCLWTDDGDEVIKFDRKHENQPYCRKEYENYCKAREYRVQQVLLPIQPYEEVNGWFLYHQKKFQSGWYEMAKAEKAKIDRTYRQYSSHKLLHKVNCKMFGCTNDLWLARCIQLYGKKFISSFAEWTMVCQIGDLHDGNIGMYDNRPVLLDYAGYFGTSWSGSF